MKNKQGFVPVLIILALAILGLVAYFGYSYLNPKEIATVPTPVVSEKPTVDETANWKTYVNKIHNIEFKYPSSWRLENKNDQIEINAELALTKNLAKIMISLNMDGIGGVGQNLSGEPLSLSGISYFKYKSEIDYRPTKSEVIGITDSLTQSLGFFNYKNRTYSIKLEYPITISQSEKQNLNAEFDKILYTFKFTN